MNKVFDAYTTGEDYGFTRTVVPVRLAQYGDENRVSRSQAKRLLSWIDRFQVVVFDFSGVSGIGQAFADGIFRVFALKYPAINLSAVNVTSAVKQMVSRAQTS